MCMNVQYTHVHTHAHTHRLGRLYHLQRLGFLFLTQSTQKFKIALRIYNIYEYGEVVDFWDYSGCSDVDEEDDGLLHDPDFADSGTAWLSDEPKERAILIAAQQALRRAEEEQMLYFSLTSSSGTKKILSFVSGKSIKP